jgi:hypothetical protein
MSKATGCGLDYQGSITYVVNRSSSPQARRAACLRSASCSITRYNKPYVSCKWSLPSGTEFKYHYAFNIWRLDQAQFHVLAVLLLKEK